MKSWILAGEEGDLGNGKIRKKKYMCERDATGGGGPEEAKSAWVGSGGGFSVVTTSSREFPVGSEVS